MAKFEPLKTEELTCSCDPSVFSFKTTAELQPLKEIIGQERALKSIGFGLGIRNTNYNIFVLGEGGTGKQTTVMNFIKEKAKEAPVPDDWCYVYNFANPDSPTAINLPSGKGALFVSEMEELIATLKRDIPKVFESKDYETHRDEILDGQQERTKAVFSRLEKTAVERGVMVRKTAAGLAVVPSKDGKPLSQAEYEKLPREKKAAMEEEMKILQDKLSEAIREARRIEKETRERIAGLDREMVQYVVNPFISELLDKFKDFDKVVDFINVVKEDIFLNIDDFKPKEPIPLALGPLSLPQQEPAYERYRVNLIVSNRDTGGAPVVFESNPTYYNLFGRIEYKVQMGVATTDFTMIKGGSIHRANGGYLVVNALDMLKNIFVYDSLKRMIKTKEVKIEDVWEQYKLVSTATLKPSAIPVDIKLIIIGDPSLYYLLYNVDREYRKFFKVKADFESIMARSEENMEKYAHFVAMSCDKLGLLPFDRSGVAGVVEYGARLAGEKEKLTARFNDVQNLVEEASYWAGADGDTTVTASHIEKAIEEKRYRHSKVEDRLREYITEDTLMVDTEGAVVGQVNGIAVLSLGDYAFGKPSRITARTFMGDAGVVNLEREVKMSGRIHNKALMILKSFLGERFARDFPLTLTASVCFEQLYDEIEGDSATCAEVYALLSSISGKPIDQRFAVTGSMNQFGEVQPIGGVNEKIEGFFEVCKGKGLTGDQGVVIPRRNVKNLMLKAEVRRAVAEGKFYVYPIDMVDEGIEILTGVDAGQRGPDGVFPEGTINRLAEDRLRDLAKRFKAFGRPPSTKKHKPAENTNNNDGAKKP
ncbi:MAG: ATP-binding protein [Thermodesulfobacteriota bacterium]|nr:MAG: ATP-binding protein [Thermodesulfobacteriota bacterium]